MKPVLFYKHLRHSFIHSFIHSVGDFFFKSIANSKSWDAEFSENVLVQYFSFILQVRNIYYFWHYKKTWQFLCWFFSLKRFIWAFQISNPKKLLHIGQDLGPGQEKESSELFSFLFLYILSAGQVNTLPCCSYSQSNKNVPFEMCFFFFGIFFSICVVTFNPGQNLKTLR